MTIPSKKYAVPFNSNFILMSTAVIWGLAFVAQRKGMEFMGPFYFNGIRFLLGAACVWPFFLTTKGTSFKRKSIKAGLISGLALFAAASLQQIGLVTTSAGHAGFITGLYLVFVPVLGWLLGRPNKKMHWFASTLALVGLFLLSRNGAGKFSLGDFYVLMSALSFAVHLVIIDQYSKQHPSALLAFMQFITTAVLSIFVASLSESINWAAVRQAMFPLLYGGVASVGLGYTFQVIGQRKAHPVHAAIILSLESVFAAIGGWIILGETLSFRELLGALLMIIAIWIVILGQKPLQLIRS